MRRIRGRKIVALMVTFTLVLTCGCGSNTQSSAENQNNYNVYVSDDDWNKINTSNCGVNSKDELILKANETIEQVITITNNENWQDFYKEIHGNDYEVQFAISFTEDNSQVAGGIDSYKDGVPEVLLNQENFEHNFWNLAHEMTHLICQKYSTLAFREGLACYVQDQVDPEGDIFTLGMDVDCMANHIATLDEFQEIYDVLGTDDLSQNREIAGEYKSEYYVLANSFVSYLIHQYDMDKFMQLYQTDDITIQARKIYNKDISQLKSEWKEYITNYHGEYSWDELQERAKDIYTKHGY